MPAHTNACWQMGLGLKFLMVNYQLRQFWQSQRREKIIRSIPLFMKATILGTQNSIERSIRWLESGCWWELISCLLQPSYPVPSQIHFRQQELKLKYPIKLRLAEKLDFKNINNWNPCQWEPLQWQPLQWELKQWEPR